MTCYNTHLMEEDPQLLQTGVLSSAKLHEGVRATTFELPTVQSVVYTTVRDEKLHLDCGESLC